jgi:hypothetical protein
MNSDFRKTLRIPIPLTEIKYTDARTRRPATVFHTGSAREVPNELSAGTPLTVPRIESEAPSAGVESDADYLRDEESETRREANPRSQGSADEYIVAAAPRHDAGE